MFLLYQKKDKTYPESVKIGGDLYYINADFRNILRIFDMLDDRNISGYKKIEKLVNWFFDNNFPENISPEIAIEAFIHFVGKNGRRDVEDAVPYEIEPEESERQFCYNFDAEEIYASFMAEYGIDLIETDFLHWYKFKILLGNLSPESAFKKKIELRFMDLSDLHDIRKLTELTRAKESVQLPDDSFEKTEDLQEIKEFNEIWGKAGNN